MKIGKQFRQDLQRYFGSRGEIKKHSAGFFGDLNDPAKLGLFFCVRSKSELDEVRQLLSLIAKSYRSITAIVFFQDTGSLDVITNKSISIFSLDDFTLFGKKKESLQQMFDREKYDLLISFTFEPDRFCRKLFAEMQADFKIGPDHEDGADLYDMMVGRQKDKNGFVDYYHQVVHYLKILNVKSG